MNIRYHEDLCTCLFVYGALDQVTATNFGFDYKTLHPGSTGDGSGRVARSNNDSRQSCYPVPITYIGKDNNFEALPLKGSCLDANGNGYDSLYKTGLIDPEACANLCDQDTGGYPRSSVVCMQIKNDAQSSFCSCRYSDGAIHSIPDGSIFGFDGDNGIKEFTGQVGNGPVRSHYDVDEDSYTSYVVRGTWP